MNMQLILRLVDVLTELLSTTENYLVMVDFYFMVAIRQLDKLSRWKNSICNDYKDYDYYDKQKLI